MTGGATGGRVSLTGPTAAHGLRTAPSSCRPSPRTGGKSDCHEDQLAGKGPAVGQLNSCGVHSRLHVCAANRRGVAPSVTAALRGTARSAADPDTGLAL
jgi:hypothetical protein